MNQWLESLTPMAIWQQFRVLCDIPRPSFHEQALRDYLFNWAQQLGMTPYVDPAGNLIIYKAASAGMEDRETVVLQGHLDMVAQKESDSAHNFETDPIETFEQDGWVHAKGTTLGADNGIGVAAILAVLESQELAHGPLEALFTIEEETSLRGASQLQQGILQGKRLLNLDSEDRGDVYIGCAGGIDINVSQRFASELNSEFETALRVSIMGLKGGHSGLDIHKGRANANVLLVRLLQQLQSHVAFGVSELIGGTLRNAIARDATATLQIATSDQALVEAWLYQQGQIIASEFADTDPNLVLKIEPAAKAAHLTSSAQAQLLQALMCAPNGVHRMSPTLEGVVETSCNLGVIQLQDDNDSMAFSGCLLVRSLVDSQTQFLAAVASAPFELIGCEVLLENGYPGWKPEPNSNLLQHFNSVHQQVMGFAPSVKVIHAGLECGIIGAKYPGMEMVSFGPNIRGAHSPSERLQISSVAEFWQILVTLLAQTPKTLQCESPHE
ncbi:Cytosol non-specific dipeptidase [Marinomonas aquimarina]|uniref:Cytosol non-specific dipeptidase n=1 Tax=Marinomonas aquimarina TaxID=295068 RepID=A0A1A8TIJ1_9GAMM|nr:aminoacyl-histidine dipeptidase [Marinomonas aquimarina]SBS31975.1 Cytosol non-specific dipeptidase [Marinomonas aquimarina]